MCDGARRRPRSGRPAACAGPALARLSSEALLYAQTLSGLDAPTLSARLYRYNSLPASPTWRRRYPSPEAIMAELGVQLGGTTARRLDGRWRPVSPRLRTDHWLSWRGRGAEAPRDAPIYKLYVSPRPDALRRAWLAVVDVLDEEQALAFKVGGDVYTLLRPDKLIAYFGHHEALLRTGQRLRLALRGVAPQGVPFTAQLDDDGLLSWAIDPPEVDSRRGPSMSWRRWITARLAAALIAARADARTADDVCRLAIERVRREGVDTTTWTVARDFWSHEDDR